MSNHPQWLPAKQNQQSSTAGPQPARAAFVPQGAVTFQSPWARAPAQQKAQPPQPAPSDQQNAAPAFQSSWQQAPAQQAVPAWPVHNAHHPDSQSAHQNAWQQAPQQQAQLTDPSGARDEYAQPQYDGHGYGVENGHGSSPVQHAGVDAPQEVAPVPHEQQQQAHHGSVANAATDFTSPTFTAAARLRDLQDEIAALQVSMCACTIPRSSAVIVYSTPRNSPHELSDDVEGLLSCRTRKLRSGKP